MSDRETDRPVLLLGSLPLPSTEQAFDAVTHAMGDLVKRVPDGEPGPRSLWIIWQSEVIGRAKGLEPGGQREIPGGYKYTQYKIKEGLGPDDVELGPLGYAEAALKSYEIFKQRRVAGKFRPKTRFQISLPTPLAIVFAHFIRSSHRTIWPIYERQMLSEIDTIAAAIPHDDLAIQWDIAVEINAILERPEMAKEFPIEEIVDSIARICDHIPTDIELGLHLCYGDPPGNKQRHVVEPKDTGLMVDLANRLERAIDRPIHWLHMPVPIERTDEAYFAPLQFLKLREGTEFYLGLIHLSDGVEGAANRLAAARRYIDGFGVATECGLGRRSAETIPDLLKLHREVAALP